MTNNQMKCSIIYEKIIMWAGDDERIINYEWPNFIVIWANLSICFRGKYVFHATWVNVVYCSEKFSH